MGRALSASSPLAADASPALTDAGSHVVEQAAVYSPQSFCAERISALLPSPICRRFLGF